ncbi:MAG: hypothetical protein EZS26_000562 [Candidatus Ordinivivax streblomastigis]|uniref:DUF3990 domain-containing protein n=1 Tax=Candidatus Ordinivivax streblomastigis TaxID=2540710 RepID=A0A5M8P425_9BACT|nr:MAG: hypothetical protein EZS26_000405 [Candidatus Ordinivivax streblomastigis]KAA6303402.1 MAG: hypothetical protein EZS26_000562 [Candidatus Ordinivivax streblomastigis]
MKVYHGSYAKIETIDFNKCKPYKDFGKGFYVTNIRLQAEYWAERRGRRNGNSGHVTKFEFIETAFEHWNLNVLRFEHYNEDWLDFVILNRNQTLPVPAHDYDIVEGPVADDDVTNRIDDYIENRISKADFLEELKFHRSTHQICFCTHRSLQALERIDKKNVHRIDDSLIESLVADYGMTEEQAIDAYFESNTYQQLIDELTGLYLKPWAEVYKLLLTELKFT